MFPLPQRLALPLFLLVALFSSKSIAFGICYFNPTCQNDPIHPGIPMESTSVRVRAVKFDDVAWCARCKGVTNVNHKYRCMLPPGVSSPDDGKVVRKRLPPTRDQGEP
ncbi:hypothetical protein BDZ90DRAFT_228622 [Jaminaea rosea]|uniref:Secreted protein n=1 Tax=Jaminaea rosea TaxID=1569628 RepID=A0A316ULY3_9BASI|nr:hypothetical protein BDZ90DRAFT_228622 [Jaminaea rosea]PWN24943.1 hypothetical protein BDZ90DRAFT_228622 [Jaminaea rosea]